MIAAGAVGIAAIGGSAAAGPRPGVALRWKMVWEWSMGATPPAEIVRRAKALGFNAMQARHGDVVAECHRAGMEAYGAVWFGTAPPGHAQAMLPEEEARVCTPGKPLPERYQGGGEPLLDGEVCHDLTPWCFDRPEALAYGQERIDELLAAGYDGIAFDAIGYRNFHACYCAVSRARHEGYGRAHPGLRAEAAVRRCSEESLVRFYDALAAHARQRRPGVKLTCHVYPHFAPNPLYGNRLDVDTCGQTASWFFLPHWTLEKVGRIAREVVAGEARFHAGGIAAPFIADYSQPPNERHRKSTARLRREIRLVKQAGARAIQMAELGNILSDPDAARVVRQELAR